MTYVINQSWTSGGDSNGLVDSAGLMVYVGATSLDWVKNYVDPSKNFALFELAAFSAKVSSSGLSMSK